jgi:lipoate-protein ligase A
VTVAPAALFDVEGLRGRSAPTLGVPALSVARVVLGSTQAIGDVDVVAIGRDGLEVRRRRGGGGAVLLRPGDCWVELWLPTAPATVARHDVRADAYRVGTWWQRALSAFGVAADLHRGAVRSPAEGAVACFAGLGPGELSVAGRKLLGLSQWRAREGTLVSSVLAVRPPALLAAYLAEPSAVPRLDSATCLEELDGIPGAPDLAASFGEIAATELDRLDLDDRPFH